MACVAFVGGTGPHGIGLALRFAIAGTHVVIGSRRLDRAERAAHRIQDRLNTLAPDGRVHAAENAAAARAADVVALTVPFEALEPLLAEIGPFLAGKVILDVINPLRFEQGVFKLVPVAAGSVAALLHSLLPGAQVVSGFKNISARELWHADRALQGDVLLCGEAPAAKAMFSDLVARMPNLRAIDAGPLANAFYLESITVLLLNLNRQHHALTSLQILGI